MPMVQNYELRGQLGFIEDQLRISIAAFVAGDEAEVVAGLTNIRAASKMVLKGLGQPAGE